MVDHLGIRVGDYAASRRFYDAALAPLGAGPVMEVPAEAGVRGVGYGRAGKPAFWIGEGGPNAAGTHIAFAAADRASVDAFYAAALAAGGRDNGAPGLRPQYHPNYYAAFVFDPDGINVEAVCHAP
jgi:catechol 2,3-dioxygenase-like lactoylglutathione lyase family enzyme